MNSTTKTTAISLGEQMRLRQAEVGLTDEELSDAIGYETTAIVTMIKDGHMRLPMNKITVLASALMWAPAELLRTALSESTPDLLPVIEEVFNPLKLTDTESNLIRNLRKISHNSDAAPIVFDGNAVIALVLPG